MKKILYVLVFMLISILGYSQQPYDYYAPIVTDSLSSMENIYIDNVSTKNMVFVQFSYDSLTWSNTKLIGFKYYRFSNDLKSTWSNAIPLTNVPIPYSNSNGTELGIASSGVSTNLSRSDHVHPMPDLEDLGSTLISDNTLNDLLYWNGTKWVNGSFMTLGIQTLLTTGDLTEAIEGLEYDSIRKVINGPAELRLTDGYFIPNADDTARWKIGRLFSTADTTRGLVIGSNGQSTYFLRGDGTWAQVQTSPQDLSLLNNILSLTGDATPVDLSAYVNPDLSNYAFGAGTENYITKWSGLAHSLASSSIYEQGGNVGINTASPDGSTRLDVNGKTKTINFQMTYGATAGYFLKSDANGNGEWAPVLASSVYKGTWDASSNTPTLADGVGTAGWWYRCVTGGTVNFGSGNITFSAGDDAYYNGTVWQRVPGTTYTLVAATASVLGGVKIGTGVTVQGDGTISVSDVSATNEIQSLDTARLQGTNLELSLSLDGMAKKVIDLSSLQDGTGTDSQNLTYSKNNNSVTVNISGGTGTTFSVADADSVLTNEGTLGVSAGIATTSLITSNTSGTNGVTISVDGTNLGISESTNTNGGTITLANLKPDQTVALSNGTGINVTGTYPNFTITNTSPGGITSYLKEGTLIGQRGKLDIQDSTGIVIIATDDGTNDRVKYSVRNSAPDQTVSITGGGINNVTGTYPNFTITGTEVDGSITNEIQTISGSGVNLSGYQITASQGGGTVTLPNEADGSVTNEAQTLTTIGTTMPEINLNQVGGAGGGETIFKAITSTIALSRSGDTIKIATSGVQPTLTTGDLTENITGLQFDNTRQVIGGAAQLSMTTGYVIPSTADTTKWGGGYGNQITSAVFSGTTAKTLTLNQKDGGTVVGNFTDLVDDADASTTNELNTSVSYNSGLNQLTVTDAGGDKTVTLTGLAGGTVTSFSAGDLSELFTTTETNPTTTPALSFAAVSKAQNLIYASPLATTGTPTFRSLGATDIPNLAASKITTGYLDTARIPNRMGFYKLPMITSKRILGRYALTTGDIQEISVGSGLAISDLGVLDVTGSSGLTSAYTTMTDGTNNATSSGATTFKFRSTDNKLTTLVANDDVTHGDNLLLTVNEGNLTLNNLSGTLGVTKGGTGNTSIAQGDILYGSASNVISNLTKNTTASRYLSNSGTSNNPAWAQVNLANGVTSTLPEGNGGTGESTYTLGNILYSDASNSLAKLAGNTTTTKQFLSQTGTGAISAAPVWSAVAKGDVGLGSVENTALSTWAGTTNITTLGTIVTGAWSGTTIPINKGGTGQTTANTALNALLPTQTGNTTKFLYTDGTNSSWQAVSFTETDGSVSNEGVLGVAAGAATTSLITSNTSGATGVTITAGTGMSIAETISSNGGNITLTNSSPDQTVALTGAGINNVTGTYPNFTITGTEVDGSVSNELQNLGYTASTRAVTISGGTGFTFPNFSTTGTDPGLVTGGTGISAKFLRGDNSWQDVLTAEVDGSITNEIQNLSYTASTRALAIDGTGSTDVTLPLFSTTTTDPGLVNGGVSISTKFLRGDNSWQDVLTTEVDGSITNEIQNLGYTASTRALSISGGTGATMPLFTSTEAGLVPLSGGGTTNFLRADGTWQAAGSSKWTQGTNGIYNTGRVGVGAEPLGSPVSQFYTGINADNTWTAFLNNEYTTGDGLYIKAGTTSSDYSLLINSQGYSNLFRVMGDGSIYFNNGIGNSTTSDVLYYDSSTKKISYGAAPSGSGLWSDNGTTTYVTSGHRIAVGRNSSDVNTSFDSYQGSANYYAGNFQGVSGSNGVRIRAGSNSANNALDISDYSNSSGFFKVRGDGLILMPQYGLGNKTGTVTYHLAVDASGNVIETSAGAGGGDMYKSTYDNSGTADIIDLENGGTGLSSYTQGDILSFTTGGTALTKIAASTSGYVLTSNGAGTVPSWQAASGGVTGGASGKVAFWTGTNSLSNNTNFAWDNTGFFKIGIGLGAGVPAYALHVNTDIKIGNTSSDLRKIYFGDGTYVYIGEGVADDRLYLLGSTMGISVGGVTGSANQVLTANGAGTCSWQTPSAGGGGDMYKTTYDTNTDNKIDVAAGGTGMSAFNAYQLLIGTGSNYIGQVTTGTTGQVLTSNGPSAVPSWLTPSSGFSDPMTTRGDIIYRNSSNTTTRLGRGTSGQVLTSDGTDLSWATPSTGPNITVQTLSGTSPSWNVSSGLNAKLTMSGNTTITMSNLTSGQTGNLSVTNVSTVYTMQFSGYTFKISPALNSSAGVITMSGASKLDVLSWWYDGTYVYINGTLSYD